MNREIFSGDRPQMQGHVIVAEVFISEGTPGEPV